MGWIDSAGLRWRKAEMKITSARAERELWQTIWISIDVTSWVLKADAGLENPRLPWFKNE